MKLQGVVSTTLFPKSMLVEHTNLPLFFLFCLFAKHTKYRKPNKDIMTQRI